MYELSDLFELETCLFSHDLNQNQITTVKLTNDRWHCVFNIFGLYINLSHCTVYMVLQYMYITKIEIFTHNTIDFEHNIKVCWIKYLKNKFLFLFLFCIISPPNTIWSLIFYIIYPLVTMDIWGTREQCNSFNQGNLHTQIWAQLSIYMYIMCSKQILYLHVYQPQD